MTDPFAPLVLADGTVVPFELMDPDDGSRLRRFHATLSDDTTHWRFFTVYPELADRDVQRFTHVDHREREAIIALHDGEIIGVGRYDRLTADGDTAEVAFVVADQWQGRGIGTALLTRLAVLARRAGITRFSAATLCGNRPMLSVFHHSGFPISETIDFGVVEVTLELGPALAPDGCPDRPTG